MLNFKLKLEVKNSKVKVRRPYCCSHYLRVNPPVCCSGIQFMVDEHSGAVRIVLVKSKRSCN